LSPVTTIERTSVAAQRNEQHDQRTIATVVAAITNVHCAL